MSYYFLNPSPLLLSIRCLFLCIYIKYCISICLRLNIYSFHLIVTQNINEQVLPSENNRIIAPKIASFLRKQDKIVGLYTLDSFEFYIG